MSKEIVMFSDIEIEKHAFHLCRSWNFSVAPDIDIDIYSFGKNYFKCFTGDKDDDKKVKPLCIMLPKMNRCTKIYDETKYMSFLIKYDELLEKYNNIRI